MRFHGIFKALAIVTASFGTSGNAKADAFATITFDDINLPTGSSIPSPYYNLYWQGYVYNAGDNLSNPTTAITDDNFHIGLSSSITDLKNFSLGSAQLFFSPGVSWEVNVYGYRLAPSLTPNTDVTTVWSYSTDFYLHWHDETDPLSGVTKAVAYDWLNISYDSASNKPYVTIDLSAFKNVTNVYFTVSSPGGGRVALDNINIAGLAAPGPEAGVGVGGVAAAFLCALVISRRRRMESVITDQASPR